jgi:hypothetical protein
MISCIGMHCGSEDTVNVRTRYDKKIMLCHYGITKVDLKLRASKALRRTVERKRIVKQTQLAQRVARLLCKR